jgi:hypothetical protein
LDYFLGEVGQPYFHVFKPWKQGAEIIVFMSIIVMATSSVERVLLIRILNVVISLVDVATSPE